MRENEDPNSVREELLERLRRLDAPQPTPGLTELAYRRAREALEQALEEARRIRLEAIEQATAARERETTALNQALNSRLQMAETQTRAMLDAARIEAEETRQEAEREARRIVESGRADAALIRDEALAFRAQAEQRLREMERLEAEFNGLLEELARRIGVTEKPRQGWFRRLFRPRR